MARGRITLKRSSYCDKPENQKEVAFTLFYQTWLMEYKDETEWVFLWSEDVTYERSFKRTFRAYILCDGTQTEWSRYSDSDHGQWRRLARNNIKLLGFITLNQGDELSVGVKVGFNGNGPGFTWKYRKNDGTEVGFDPFKETNAAGKATAAVNKALAEYRSTGQVKELEGTNYIVNPNALQVDFTPLVQQQTVEKQETVYGAHHTLTAPGYIIDTSKGTREFVPFTDYRTGKSVPLRPGDTIERDAIPPYYLSRMATQANVEAYEVISVKLTDRSDLPHFDEFIVDDVNAVIQVREVMRGSELGGGYPDLALR